MAQLADQKYARTKAVDGDPDGAEDREEVVALQTVRSQHLGLLDCGELSLRSLSVSDRIARGPIRSREMRPRPRGPHRHLYCDDLTRTRARRCAGTRCPPCGMLA